MILYYRRCAMKKPWLLNDYYMWKIPDEIQHDDEDRKKYSILREGEIVPINLKKNEGEYGEVIDDD